MLFNSIEFLIFFPIVVALYFLTPYRYRWPLLLAASYYFYMCWKPEYLVLIVVSTLIDYGVGLQLGKTREKGKRRRYLLLSLTTNLGLLFAFKYFNFFNDSARALFQHFNLFYGIPAFHVLLPVGISFYTFQTLSYTIDVYRGAQAPERHLGIFALYVAFFPQLVAGPIERSTRLLPQFYRRIDFDYERVTDGLKLMLWGFFKKIVIADRLALFVNAVYNDPTSWGGVSFIAATVFFAFQIYCDFSGYSDIAIGGAQILGYDLMDNFNRPYFSKSIGEFWKRWHISLSTWFRDYLYIPLGGNRVPKGRWYFNLFTVFLVSGLWHGANWTFVLWGALHGCYLILGVVTARWRRGAVLLLGLDRRRGLLKWLNVTWTFLLVSFAWIFFRANSISDAFYIVGHLFDGVGAWLSRLLAFDLGRETIAPLLMGQNLWEFVLALGSIAFMEFVHLLQRHYRMRHFMREKPRWLRWTIYYAILFAILMFGKFSLTEFIYFQF